VAGSVAERILAEHLVDGQLIPGRELAIRIDHTLTQDATGTLAFLQFEALRLDRVRNELAVSYVDHNMLQTGFENADDSPVPNRARRIDSAMVEAGFRDIGRGCVRQSR